jgi:methyltransferase (TIGR00027 family)
MDHELEDDLAITVSQNSFNRLRIWTDYTFCMIGQQKLMPSRTAILVAAARAFGSRDPDPDVRNPDLLADKLMGPEELALIRDHPLSKGLEQDYAEASQNPAIVLLASLMILRTRFIDDAMKRAVEGGASQIIILGAGFDSRAYRFRDLLKNCRVIEVDARVTQEYKRRRIEALGEEAPSNLSYVSVDFAADDVGEALLKVGFGKGEKCFFIWEGVSMYLPEASVRKMLQTVEAFSATGSTLVLDYANSLGIELTKQSSQGTVGLAASWGEPWIFGVPGANGDQFFRELGFDAGTPLSLNNPEVIKRYAVRKDGTTYGAHLIEKLKLEAQTKSGTAPTPSSVALEAQRAIAAAGGVYWMSELTVSGELAGADLGESKTFLTQPADEST